jgi:HD-like signal output (HDOD) protein
MDNLVKKNVLFVDDEPNVTQGLKRMLRHLRKEWEMFFAASGPEALEIMQTTPVDVIVSDMRMPGMDGSELLSIVRDRYPETIRIVLSGQSSKEAILRAVGASHQYLAKPCDADMLKTTVSRAFKLRDIVTGDRLKSIVAKMTTLPTLPESYTALLNEMRSEEPSLSRIAKLIEKDVAMTAKILQVVNSAYFGVRRKITSPDEAVRYLGLENISALVLAANVFGQVEESVQVPGFSMAALWDHSGEVGRLAQLILKHEHKRKDEIDEVLAAGLLHDCGKLIFCVNLREEYALVLKDAKESGDPVFKVERRILGADHAEVGAYLLGIWGLPDTVVEAVAAHHNLGEFPSKGCTGAIAVYVAEAFSNDRSGASIDHQYLEASGVADRLPVWMDLMKSAVEG